MIETLGIIISIFFILIFTIVAAAGTIMGILDDIAGRDSHESWAIARKGLFYIAFFIVIYLWWKN